MKVFLFLETFFLVIVNCLKIFHKIVSSVISCIYFSVIFFYVLVFHILIIIMAFFYIYTKNTYIFYGMIYNL